MLSISAKELLLRQYIISSLISILYVGRVFLQGCTVGYDVRQSPCSWRCAVTFCGVLASLSDVLWCPRVTVTCCVLGSLSSEEWDGGMAEVVIV